MSKSKSRRQEERRAALQDFAVAQAEWPEAASLDPRTPLWPGEDFRTPMPIPGKGGGPAGRSSVDFASGIARNWPKTRPRAAAVDGSRAARFRPFLPSVSLAYNWGGFGGGPRPQIGFSPSRGTVKEFAQPGFGPSANQNISVTV